MAKKNKQPQQFKQKRKAWFRFMKKLMKGRYPRPKFVYLGKKPTNGSIILSNHEGTDAPLSLELYADFPVRMWGAHEMNSGLIPMYKYQTRVYYHEKKHWNLHLARLFCLIASPLTNLFYKGLNLISTYRDSRFKKTIRESTEAIVAGENIVIFPEQSEKGYLEVLEGFFAGFAVFCETCLKKGIDVPIYVSYFKKKELVYIFSEPVMYSTLKAGTADRDELVNRLLVRCNELGQMTFDSEQNDLKKENK